MKFQAIFQLQTPSKHNGSIKFGVEPEKKWYVSDLMADALK